MTTIMTVLGTRPEIIKLSPLIPLLETRWEHVLVHTGQHYDDALDGVFFDELRLRAPEYRLRVGSGSHGAQTAHMLLGLEPVLEQVKPDVVLVQGDTNSTLAGALAASKRGVPVVHLEAGCRSFNRRMPEEINRVLIDHCSDLLLAADEAAQRNLLMEGLMARQVAITGSTAIDACLRNVRLANTSSILQRIGLQSRGYLLCTVHRAENTDPAVLPRLVATLNLVARRHPLVIPLHPRTQAAMSAQGLAFSSDVQVIAPLGYLDMLQMLRHARAVLTDSGGLQEEAGALNVPLLILREETEWTYLVGNGKAALVGTRPDAIMAGLDRVGNRLPTRPVAAGSGMGPGAARRAIDVMATWLGAREGNNAWPRERSPQTVAA